MPASSAGGTLLGRRSGGRGDCYPKRHYAVSSGACSRPRVGTERVILERRQAQPPRDPGNVGRTVAERPETARERLGSREVGRSARQRPHVYPLDLAVARVDARREVGDTKSWRVIRRISAIPSLSTAR